MIFVQTELKGLWLIDLEKKSDDRGFFARSWCVEEFGRHGLKAQVVQCNISFNRHKGTLRGLHFQAAPHAEAKLVRCTRGAIHDVAVDLRQDSPSYGRWIGVDLTADNQRMLYIPEGFAHGFQTLQDNSEVFYQMSEFFHPELSRGIRWNDPLLDIQWPLPNPQLSERDRTLPGWENPA